MRFAAPWNVARGLPLRSRTMVSAGRWRALGTAVPAYRRSMRFALEAIGSSRSASSTAIAAAVAATATSAVRTSGGSPRARAPCPCGQIKGRREFVIVGRPLAVLADTPAVRTGIASHRFNTRPGAYRTVRPRSAGALGLPRVVVDLELLLGRADVLGDVAEVHPDPGPRGEPPAHRVDQHVGRLQVLGRLRVALLPPLQPGLGLLLGGGARDLDQRHLALAPAGARALLGRLGPPPP